MDGGSSVFKSHSPLAAVLLSYWLFHLPALVSANCECGYSTTIGVNSTQRYVFADLLESNFARIRDISRDPDWQRQAFNLTKTRARGDYGEMFAVDNIVSTIPADSSAEIWDDKPEEIRGGMQLVVRKQLVDDMVPVAEIDTQRQDVFYGTFRASMKMTGNPGTCAAFFWYFNDTQEIDMEFLSKDFNPSNNSYPVNLVLQSRQAAEAGYNAASTGNFIKAFLPFDPTTDFHEYRIDYIPGRVYFYADGEVLAEMTGSAVPISPGHLILQHWSNGNPLWSGGPPLNDSALTVEYVKAYFNSSLPRRHADWAARCTNATAPGAICEIPNLDKDWFFGSHPNMTPNQTVWVSNENAGSRLQILRWWTIISALLLVNGWLLGLW